jgi:hypothetical protein
MATRPLPLLTALLILTTGIAGHAQTTKAPEDQRPPTALERILQDGYIDQYYVLREDVKVEALKTKQVLSTTYPKRANVERVRPITIVTPDGVFYSNDYDSQVQLEMDVRPGASILYGDATDQADAVRGGNIGDVVEFDFRPRVALAAGSVARVVGVQEAEAGVEVTLEGFTSDKVMVLLRGEEKPEPVDEPELRSEFYAERMAQLFYKFPRDPAERMEWVDAAWPADVQSAIREQRVVAGMDHFQVVLAWGVPVYVSREDDSRTEIWLFNRGASILDQLKNQTNVHFAAGQVVRVDAGKPR